MRKAKTFLRRRAVDTGKDSVNESVEAGRELETVDYDVADGSRVEGREGREV